ncbi:MAG: CRP-like cAMP-activated global transcriptional regulator [Elusimicrobia bacterium]|nr:CRP-like cAMP-activated global transcriptional regulator [Elusimicrobiota bacterium]
MKTPKPFKSVDVHQLSTFLRGVELLNALPSEDLVRLAEICQLVKFKRAERIFSADQPGGCLYVVMSGRVKIFGSSSQGRSKTFAYLEPGDFFGEMSLIDDAVRSASASALQDSVLIMLKREDYQKLMLSRPSMAMAVLKTLALRLRRANKEIEALSFNNVLGRIAQILLDLSERYGKKTEHGIRIDMELSHKELSEMAGTAREVISRVISRFRKIGCVSFQEGKIIVTDQEKLKGWIF